MLEAESDFTAAERGLENLVKKLEALRAVTSNARGYGNTASGLKKIGEAGESLNASSANNLKLFVDALQGLQNIGKIKISSSIASQIKNIGLASQNLRGVDFTPLNDLAGRLKPLADIPKASGLVSTITALRKLPTAISGINENLDDQTIARFAERVTKLRDTIVPLADEMRAVSAGFSILPSKIKRAIESTKKFGEESEKTNHRTNGLLRKLLNIGAAYLSIRSVFRFGMSAFEESNNFVEAINLSNVAMGKGAEKAREYARQVEEMIGINMTDWMTQMGTFNQMLAGFGISQKQSAHMSQQLTQLGYDIQSAFNVSDLSQVMDRLQSGLAGQIKGMREYGVELSVSAMKEFALARGITKSWTAMSTAEKTALRYAKIMEDTQNIQQDLARTLVTPSNALRVLNAQWDVARRYIGQFVSVIAAKVIPVLQTLVSVIGAIAKALATAWGYALPDIPTSDYVGGFEDVEDAVDGIGGAAGGASKKLKGLLASWDEINVIQSESGGGGGGGGSGVIEDAFDFSNLTSYGYDFLDGIKKRTQEISGIVQNAIPYVKAVAAGFASWVISSKLTGALGALGVLKDITANGLAWKIPLAITGVVSGFSLMLDTAQTVFEKGHVDVADLVHGAIGFAVTAIPVGIATGSVAAAFAIAGGVALAATVTAFYLQKQKEYSEMAAASFAKTGEDGFSPEDMIAAVETEFAKRAGSAKLVIDAYAEVGNYNEALKEATTQIAALNDVIFGDEALTETQAESFKASWNTVTTTLDSITNASYNTVFAGLVQAAQSANEELAKEAEKAKKNLIMIQTGYNERQTERKLELNDLVDKILRNEATEEDMDRYAALSEFFSVTDEDRTKKIDFEKALANATYVNYKDIDDVKRYSDELMSAYEEYSGVNDKALQAFTESAEIIRSQAYGELELGEITEEEYKNISKYLDNMISIYTRDIEARNEELKQQTAKMFEGVWQQAFQNPDLKDMGIGPMRKYISEILEPILSMMEDSGVFDEQTLLNYKGLLNELKYTLTVTDDMLDRVSGDEADSAVSAQNQKRYLHKHLPNAKELNDELMQSGLLDDGVKITLEVDTDDVTPALDEAKREVEAASKAINDALTFDMTITVKTLNHGGRNSMAIPTMQPFATGGIPTTGSLFIANEDGPELVGQFGSGTGVANNEQIVAGIASGVAQANNEQNAILREQNSLLKRLLDKEFTAQVTPSVGFGQAAKRAIDMYSRVSGVNW